MSLPAYDPAMVPLFQSILNAFRAHWAEHNGAYPTKLRLTPHQAVLLEGARQYGRFSLPGAAPAPKTEFCGRPIEIDPSTPGELVAVDGTVKPLSGS